jgi:hypothetical protein
MTFLRRSLLALSMITALASTGCVQIGVAVLEGVIKAAASSGGGRSNGGGSIFYHREGATPVEGPVDRAMSACELERGRWREEHQEQDDVPPALRCTLDGGYPRVPLPAPTPTTATARAPSPAATPAEAPAATPGDAPQADAPDTTEVPLLMPPPSTPDAI